MGFGRAIWRTTAIGRIVDTVRNVYEEGDIKEGIKRTLDEDMEDARSFIRENPITRPIYKSGKDDGKKEGYNQASAEYEKKLLEQAELFLKQRKICEAERDQYEKLLDEYEEEITRLESKINKTETEKEYLHELWRRESQLRKLSA